MFVQFISIAYVESYNTLGIAVMAQAFLIRCAKYTNDSLFMIFQ